MRKNSTQQIELDLRDWRPMFCAPRTAVWIEAELEDRHIARIHFAQDFTGEYQPAFSGWYYDAGNQFYEIFPKPVRWRPLE